MILVIVGRQSGKQCVEEVMKRIQYELAAHAETNRAIREAEMELMKESIELARRLLQCDTEGYDQEGELGEWLPVKEKPCVTPYFVPCKRQRTGHLLEWYTSGFQ